MINKMTYLGIVIMLVILSLTTIISCENKVVPVNIDIITHINIFDNKGRDLLNPSTTESYKKDAIRIYYLKNGLKEEVFHANYTWPRNFDIIKNDLDEYAMVIVPNDYGNNGDITTTIISWNNNDSDTLKTEIIKFESTVKVTSISKIWVNDKLYYDDRVNGRSQWGIGYVDRLVTINK